MIFELYGRLIIEILFVSGGGLVLLLLYLLVERILLSQKIRKIPLRICVTGTRGKSSVTRLIAGALKENGLKVLAKTTGSKPVLIFPDGTEKEIHRRGSPSVLEGKEVLDIAAKLGVQAVVAEMMGIRAETIAVESAHLFRPHILVITNTRLDHLDQMGKTKEDIAGCFASAITEQSAVFVPEEEFLTIYKEKTERSNSKIYPVSRDAFLSGLGDRLTVVSPFVRDVQLSLAVAELMGVNSETALSGMKRIRPDFGSLKAWKSKTILPARACLFINAFAANDPESTTSVFDFLWGSEAFEGRKLIALLNFRRDRGDRTHQWLRALQKGFLSDFDRVVLLGDHARFVKNRLKTGCGLTDFITSPFRSPLEILADAVFQEEENVVVGMGNMGGIGQEFVNCWEEVGEPYDF
jgi:poly-gamma-glutamate synthase PgsB/CapB